MARKKTIAAPAPVVARIRREVPEPAWLDNSYTSLQTSSLTVRRIVKPDSVWVLPSFQRDVVWGPDRQAGFCNSVVRGLPTASVLVWNRYIPGKGATAIVLDGQQRLTSLGATVLRADGTRNPSSGAFFDLATGRFSTDPGRWALTAKDVCSFDFFAYREKADELEETDPEGYDLWDHLIYARDMVGDKQIVFHIIDERATPEFVVDSFRAINQPGVPFDLAEVERLVQSAVDFK